MDTECVASTFRDLQDTICRALEAVDDLAQFREDVWQREGGGGGRSRVLSEGRVFEKAGVNFSDVSGTFDPALARAMPGTGDELRATGISLVLHPRSPMVPATHANLRFMSRGDASWFGGGADLTPTYPYVEDVVHFHSTWKEACDRHGDGWYARFKQWCDEYFFLPHRGEARGVGGIFFDYLGIPAQSLDPAVRAHAALALPTAVAPEAGHAFVRELGPTFLRAYLPIVERRRDEPYGEREREFQLIRRGRYVEFNLLYDRGTVFGLRSGGRTESILMSLPPLVRWDYDHRPLPGSREAALAEALLPRDWLAATEPDPPRS